MLPPMRPKARMHCHRSLVFFPVIHFAVGRGSCSFPVKPVLLVGPAARRSP